MDLTIPIRSLAGIRLRKGNDSSCKKNSFFKIKRMSWITQQGITTPFSCYELQFLTQKYAWLSIIQAKISGYDNLKYDEWLK